MPVFLPLKVLNRLRHKAQPISGLHDQETSD
jgi:hypothetical protein